MNIAKKYVVFAATLLILTFIPSCSDDLPAEPSAEDVLGIFSEAEGHFMEFTDPDHMFDYSYLNTGKYEYWLKRPQAYFYEPHSKLMAKEDYEGNLHIFRVMQADDNILSLCWVASPELNGLEGDGKYELLRMFIKNEYDYDPANTVVYRRITPEELKAAIGGVEVVVP